MTGLKKRRSVWLSTVRPQDVIFDAKDDEYCNSQWTGSHDDHHRRREREERERERESEEVERRMDEWDAGRLEWLPEDDGGESGEEDVVFFDAQVKGASEVQSEGQSEVFHSVVADESDAAEDWQSCESDWLASFRKSEEVSSDHSNDDLEEVSSDHFDEEELERAELTKLTSMGVHIKDTNVFALERMINKKVATVMIIYYVAFVGLVIYGFVSQHKSNVKVDQLAIVPGGEASGMDPICYPQPQQVTPYNVSSEVPCTPDPEVTVNDATLLANTVVVSEGIEVSDWAGNGALPGTQPFFAHNISRSSFMINGSALSFDANPELHAQWDIISSAVWYGQSGGGRASLGVMSATFQLKFIRTDGAHWNRDTADYPLPINIHAYACVRGANCSNVGDYRSQVLQPRDNGSYTIVPKQSLEGGTYVLSLAVPNSLIGNDMIESYGWRLVLHGDPNGVVTSCLAGVDCIMQTALTSAMNETKVTAIIDTIVLVSYFFFFLWWIFTFLRTVGLPNLWAVEQQWLLIMGIGQSLFNNVFSVALEMSSVYKSDFVFNEYMWAASLLVTQFGWALQLFSFAAFADSPRRYVADAVSFYFAKFSFCFVFYLTSVVIVIWRYPRIYHLDQPGTESEIGALGYVTSARTLPQYDKVVTSISALVMATCIVFTFIYYITRMIITSRVLKELPYNMTRPVQISHRFFIWAMSIWIAAEIIDFAVNVAAGIRNGAEYSVMADTPIDQLVVGLDESRFYTKERSVVKVLFGAIFTATFQALFSSPSAYGPVKARKTHHDTEKDAAYEATAKKVKKRLGLIVQEDIVILERARLLCVCSREVYLPFDEGELVGQLDRRDVERGLADDILSTEAGDANESTLSDHEPVSLGMYLDALSRNRRANNRTGKINGAVPRTREEKVSLADSNIYDASPRARRENFPLADSFVPAGFDESIPIRLAGAESGIGGLSPPGSTSALGCRVVARFSEPRLCDMHNTRAIAFRQISSGDLILSFRGTLTMKQVKTDLMWSKIRVSLDTFLAVPSKREKARRDLEGLAPEDLEEQINAGHQTKVRLLDLLHYDGDDLPDFLKSATKSTAKQQGTCRIHFGFWSSYSRIRREIHNRVREELLARPGRLFICGHSLGGAQATLCAYDMARWVIPTVKKELKEMGRTDDAERITICHYSYGSPRVGNYQFRRAYKKACRDTQRIVCDGDIIVANPPRWMKYVHIGRENDFDATGSIRVDPTLIEQEFALKNRNSPDSHRLNSYAKAIKRAYQPTMSVVELLNLVREAYGLDKIVVEGNTETTSNRM